MNIIGGSGFIGTRLVSRLSRNGHKVSILDLKKSGTFPDLSLIADVRDTESVSSKLSSDVVINLAAEHRDDVTPKSLYDDVNVEGARNVCEAAEANNVRTIVFTSSVAVYGFAPLGTNETGSFNPFNDYGRTKLEAEYI